MYFKLLNRHTGLSGSMYDRFSNHSRHEKAIHVQTFIFDFGGVLINWDPHHLFNKYFANDNHAIDLFLEEINFSDWKSFPR